MVEWFLCPGLVQAYWVIVKILKCAFNILFLFRLQSELIVIFHYTFQIITSISILCLYFIGHGISCELWARTFMIKCVNSNRILDVDVLKMSTFITWTRVLQVTTKRNLQVDVLTQISHRSPLEKDTRAQDNVGSRPSAVITEVARFEWRFPVNSRRFEWELVWGKHGFDYGKLKKLIRL